MADPRSILGLVIFYGWTASFLATNIEIVSLSANEREAMAWVRDINRLPTVRSSC